MHVAKMLEVGINHIFFSFCPKQLLHLYAQIIFYHHYYYCYLIWHEQESPYVIKLQHTTFSICLFFLFLVLKP